MKKTGAMLILLSLITLISSARAQLEQNLPTIVSFSSDTPSLSLAEVEAASQTITFSWKIINFKEDYIIQLYAYEIATWVLLNDSSIPPLTAEGNLQIQARHPLNFNPPSYRLIVTNAQFEVFSESILTIPYEVPEPAPNPQISLFTVTETSLERNAVAYDKKVVNVAWEVSERTPTAHLQFEQVMSDGSVVSVELSRRNPWIMSSGQGVILPSLPDSGDVIALRLKLYDVVTGALLDEAGQQVAVTGVLSTATPAPTTAPVAAQPPSQNQNQNQNPAPAQAAPPPVTSAGAGSGFELGGHIATFANVEVARSAGMTWVKKQIRWRRGEGTGNAESIINSAKGSGFKVLLGIVGYSSEMGDFEAYTNEFAAYLGQVAALNPDAIEVWNEPNIDREWPSGQINGGNYTTMLAKAFNAIKSANPNTIVISGAPAPTGFFGGGCAAGGCDDNAFLRQMANAGAAQYMDCVGAHYNEGIISPDQTSGDPRGGHYSRYFVAMLNLYYNTFGGTRPVCWTELGFLTPEGYSALPGNFAWAQNTTLAQHVEWLGLAAQRSRESGRVRLLIVWNVDFAVYDSDPQAGYAIIRADGSCPACGALAGAR